ncbi:hypothetical protein PVAP13_6KG088100 [Panicum virgatum]|uniref:Uncharacterized protein n=1 Tax=Panicum virgatum TaxID=38727 RepID=A0A8T0RAG6_PANVG|nr:hypothetical protein PVAP13_6KG088100 [Panicum virgatum]KAG2582131.1 hypothetical protein PVAP13_6KG088100 [Panicum virgatum]
MQRPHARTTKTAQARTPAAAAPSFFPRLTPNPGVQLGFAPPIPAPSRRSLLQTRPQSRCPARILRAPHQPAIGAPSPPDASPTPAPYNPHLRRSRRCAARTAPVRPPPAVCCSISPGEVLRGRLPSAPLPRRAAAPASGRQLWPPFGEVHPIVGRKQQQEPEPCPAAWTAVVKLGDARILRVCPLQQPPISSSVALPIPLTWIEIGFGGVLPRWRQ